MIVADAYYGLYRVNVDTGAKEVLVPASLEIEGKKNMVTNSLAITKDGKTVFYTSSRYFHNFKKVHNLLGKLVRQIARSIKQIRL